MRKSFESKNEYEVKDCSFLNRRCISRLIVLSEFYREKLDKSANNLQLKVEVNEPAQITFIAGSSRLIQF